MMRSVRTSGDADLGANPRTLIACVVFGAALLGAREAYACATCGCGDPTLAGMGTERPYANRLRASIEARYRTDAIGTARVDRIELAEGRLDPQLAWAPTDRLFLMVSQPLLRRTVTAVNGGETTTTAAGDTELRLKLFVFEERPFSPKHLFALVGGAKLPTAPRERDASGRLLPIELQPGTGSVDPILGLSYAYAPRPWALYWSAFGSAPLSSKEIRASASVRSTLAVQMQATSFLAPRLSLDARLDGPAFQDRAPERDSGGLIVFVSPELLLSPITDWTVSAAVRVPTVNALRGEHYEGPIFSVGLAYDF